MKQWSKPKYPGAPVRNIWLVRNEIGGDIRIQHYGDNVRVASFLPGYVSAPPGDTPKIVPEQDKWFAATNVAVANAQFDIYLAMAKASGWKVEKEF